MELTNNNETRSKNKELFEDIMSGLSDKLINNFGLKETGSKYTFKGKGVRKLYSTIIPTNGQED